ncbi:MAG: L,D-transpeptidase [Actinomycetota bacterium]
MIHEIDESTDADVFLDADEFDDEWEPNRPSFGDVLRRVLPWLAASLVIVSLVFTVTERAASQGPVDTERIDEEPSPAVAPDDGDGIDTDIEVDPDVGAGGDDHETTGDTRPDVADQAGSPGIAVVATSITGVDRLVARAQPDPAATVVADLAASADEPVTVLVVADHAELHRRWDRHTAGGRWLEVHLPVRPNGTTGWIPLADVELFRNAYRIEVDRASFRLRVFEENEPVLEAPVGIGTGDTPTPVGTFYTEDLLRVADPDGPYGPYAFVLSGHSERLSSFNGGDAIIGIHGTDNPDAVGSEVSHGCIRLHNDVISHLAEFVPLGTPIVIT